MINTKLRARVGFVCIITALAFTVLKFARCSKPSEPEQGLQRTGKPVPVTQAQSENKTEAESDASESMESVLAKDFREFRKPVPIETLKGFLAAHGNDATSCAIAFDLSEDVDFLMQAWERHKGDRFITARVALSGSKEMRLEAAREMVSNNPNDALGYYLLAKNLPAGEASILLNKIAVSTMTDFRAPDTYSYLRDAYQHLGYENQNARLLACFGSATDISIAAAQSHVINESLAEKRDEDQLYAAAAAAEHLARQSQWSLASYMAALSQKRDILEEMDPKTAFGDTGDTVQNQLLQMEAERARMQKVIFFDPNTLTVAERDVFIERTIKSGQVFAVQKLLEEREQTK